MGVCIYRPVSHQLLKYFSKIATISYKILNNILSLFFSNILLRLESPGQTLSPYFPVTVKNTREVAGFNPLAEALLRLDFIRAVSDVRRFQYVSQLMYLLFAHDKLSMLPGAAQKVLFRMLEEMANTVYKSNANQHVFRKLMDELQTTMTIYRVWGSHLGSSQLFKQHLESRRRITEFVEKMQVKHPRSKTLFSRQSGKAISDIFDQREKKC